MPKRFYPSLERALGSLVLSGLLVTGPVPAQAFFGDAKEWTQLLNNAELMALTGKSAEQIRNQITQIGQLAEQIQNQIRIYENMLQNTARLPERLWNQVEADLKRLQDLVTEGEGIAFSMANVDQALSERFRSFAEFKTGLKNGQNFSDSYQQWSDTNRGTIAATLRSAGLSSSLFESEEGTMKQLRAMSDSAIGQMQALQVGHDIAVQQVAQVQKLRGLVSQQMTMTATWYQSEQAARDLAQLRREKFFNANPPSMSGGQEMEPRW